MSVEKDPLCIQEDEEVLGAEDESADDESQEIFACKYCEYQTENIDDLDEHIITHEEVLEDEDETEGGNPLGEASTVAQAASRKPESIDLTKDGSVRQTLPAFYEEFANKPNKKVFVCPYCGYQSMKKLDMNNHIKAHRKPVELPVYACAECPYTTRRKCDMPKHLLTHCKSGTVPMFRCSECHYSTKRRGDLSKHMLCHSKTSRGYSVFSCSECHYSSRRHGDLKKHLACHEDGGGAQTTLLFNCTECGYTSKRLNDLHKHAALHCDRTVKGVFKCPKCEYASAAGSHFAKHILSHCKIKAFPVSIFPKDNSMQEYIVLEEEELHLYQLDKDNVSPVEVVEKQVVVSRPGRKRKYQKPDQYNNSKRCYYLNAENDSQSDFGTEEGNSKVVVLPGYNENGENN